MFFLFCFFKHGLINHLLRFALNNVSTHVYFFICEYIEKIVDFVVVFSSVNICNYQTAVVRPGGGVTVKPRPASPFEPSSAASHYTIFTSQSSVLNHW